MHSKSAGTSFFITVTDIHENAHVATVFFGSLLELQTEEGKLREQYQGEHLVVMTYPSMDQVRSNELNDVYYQAQMQTMIMSRLHNPRNR